MITNLKLVEPQPAFEVRKDVYFMDRGLPAVQKVVLATFPNEEEASAWLREHLGPNPEDALDYDIRGVNGAETKWERERRETNERIRLMPVDPDEIPF